jgi:hypothetical protein
MQIVAKLLNLNVNRNLSNATDLNPADFPLGSLQSRAIARRLSAQLNSLPPVDEDALILFGGAGYLHGGMTPSSSELGATAIYKRGAELWQGRSEPVLAADADPRSKRATLASLEFEWVFGREPEAGDTLTSAQVYESRSSEEIELEYGMFIEAWKRQLPELPCPLRLQAGRLFRRVASKSEEGAEWQEAVDVYGPAHWRFVEYEASRDLMRARGVHQLEKTPHIAAVVFSGVVDGRHLCKAR